MRVLAVLRRADLDAKDRAIIKAVAEAWGAGKASPSYRELLECTGLRSTNTIYWRINGGQYGYDYRSGGLVGQGWLSVDEQGAGLARTLRPGPRFAGLDADGWPLERVDVSPERVEAAMRRNGALVQ